MTTRGDNFFTVFEPNKIQKKIKEQWEIQFIKNLEINE